MVHGNERGGSVAHNWVLQPRQAALNELKPPQRQAAAAGQLAVGRAMPDCNAWGWGLLILLAHVQGPQQQPLPAG